MRRVQIYVPGILTFPGASANWDGKAVTHTHVATDFRAEKVECLVGPIDRVVGQDGRANKLFKTLSYYNAYDTRVLVGHSNGADIILTMFRDHPDFQPISQLHLVCGATEADFETNGLNALLRANKVERVYVYVAGKDWALKLAKTLPARFLGYGYLGLAGALNVAPDVRQRVQQVDNGPWVTYGHSGCWAGSEFEATMGNFLQP